MLKTTDLNCDMGEGMDTDGHIMPFISSANIACGYHAGNTDTIKKTIELCLEHNVAAGAHPSFLDRENFGRKEQYLSDAVLYDTVSEQLHSFETIATAMGCKMHHVKPHGALYNMAAKNAEMSSVLAKAIKNCNDKLIVYGLAGSHLLQEAAAMGLRTASEVFADRTYQHNGLLTLRSQAGAMVATQEMAVQQVMQMVTAGTVTTMAGTAFAVKADTICLHGDATDAVSFARIIHNQLKANHIAIKTI